MLVSSERFIGVVSFDYEKGLLKWCGDRQGTKNKSHRKSISISGQKYPAQRLCWFIHYGVWPTGHLRRIGTGGKNPYDLNIKNYYDDKTDDYKGIFKPW